MVPAWSPELGPDNGPFSVRIDKGEWVDASRGHRVVKYKAYRPEELSDGPYPTILWSHGLGGTRDGAGFIARHMASHGYIHINIDHEGTNDSLWRGLPGHPWDNIKKAHVPWEDVRNRYLDVPFALNQIEGLYADQIDWDRVGMSGHSFGALTTQVMAGQLAERLEQPLEDFSDDRFKAAIAYSPTPSLRFQQGGENVYQPIHLPMLHVTGTRDESPVEGFGFERRLEVFENAGNTDQHLVVLNDADHMVFAGSRGQLQPYAGMDIHEEMIKILSLAWWQARLINDTDAQSWLNNNVQDWLSERGFYRRKS